MGLTSVEDYKTWCVQNGFSTRIDKHWRDRCRERYIASRDAIERRLTCKRTEKRKLGRIIQGIFDGELGVADLTQPDLVLIHQTATRVENEHIRVLVCEVTRIIANNHIHILYVEGVPRGTGVWTFEPNDDGTRLCYRVDLEPQGWLPRFLSNFLDFTAMHSRLMETVFAGLEKWLLGKAA